MKRYQITLDDQTYLVEVLSDPRQREVKVQGGWGTADGSG
jgi:hypothetical protein